MSNTKEPLDKLRQDPHVILLQNAFIDTSVKLNLPIPKNLQSKGDPGSYIVQARGVISPAFKSMLALAGASVVSYIPNNAYLVRASESVATELEANVLVQAVIPYEPYYKVQESLLGMADQSLPPNIQLNLALFPDDAAATIQQITQSGGLVLAETHSLAGYPVIKVEPPADWTAIAQLPGVHIVEPVRRRHLANDLARPALGVAADSITPTNYMNLNGKNIIVAVNDSGIDTNHPDFSNNNPANSRVFYEDPALGVDFEGHGTHVAGIIAGDGFESETVTNASGSIMPGTNVQFRGKAPFARMLSMSFNDADIDLQQTAATNNALISNNSWGFDGDFDYDLAAASYDAATRDSLPFQTGSQPVTYVFSAGNDGDGGIPDTITSPGTAKDIITVGALEELRFITNQVTNTDGTVSQPWLGETDDPTAVPGFSSCGNVGIGLEGTFGRFKPDVVAPGTFVVSCRSKDWDTNSYYHPLDGTFYDFPDLIPPDSLSLAPFNFFVPSNAVLVTIQTVTNFLSPATLPVMPLYLSTNNSPFSLIGSNFVAITPSGSSLGQNWSLEASNTTTAPLIYDLLVNVFVTNNLGNYYQVLQNMNDTLGTQPEYYRYESGTSMSAAAISGFLALIEDYFTNQFYQPFTPSPALLKAMTVNGSRVTGGYDFQVQNAVNFEGWGLPDLSNSIPVALTNIPTPNMIGTMGPPCATYFREQTVSNALATGDNETFTIQVNTNDFGQDLPLRVTVAWTDPPGDPSAGIKLVNNLQLVVTDLDNTNIVYYGNDIGPGQIYNTAENSTNAPIMDGINNIENVFIQPPLDGNYSVAVIGNRVNVNAVPEHPNNDVQDFAMVISSGDMGEITDAFTVVDGGVVSNPTTFQNINGAATNSILINQIAGANTPLINTNFISLIGNTAGIGTNSQFEVGMTNQWIFYVVTNNTGFTNAAFITFGANTLAIPRMGVFANAEANATTPGADLDLLVTRDSIDPNARNLTNLDLVEISNCVNGVNGDGASLASGGTDFVAYTNATKAGEVFYIGIKSESHQAVQFGFIPIFSQQPFGGSDQNGNQYVNGLNVPQNIPDGTPSRPGIARVFMLDLNPVQIQNVVITNTILHQNFGDLVGSITHSGTTVVLNNHDSLSVPAPPGPYTSIYDDGGQNPVPGSQPSDGPGSLKNYIGTQGQGVWMLTEEGTALAQTGQVQQVQEFLQKHQPLGNGLVVTAVVQPGEWFYDFLDVPPGYTNLEIFGTNATAAFGGTVSTSPAVQMFLLDGAPPTATDFDFEVLLNQGVPPGNEISDGPPLASGVYWVGLFNPSATPQTILLSAQLNGPGVVPQPSLFSATNSTPILINAVTNNTVFVANSNLIESVNVGVVVQYPRISDLAFTLISPIGQRVLLMENRGGLTATNAGGIFFITNSFGTVTASGGQQANTNSINLGVNNGTLGIFYNMYQIPDQMTVYYGNDPTTFNTNAANPFLLFNSGLVSGSSNVVISFGPGTSTFITIIMNQFGNPSGGTAWTYTLNGTLPDYNFLTFTEDTNLTTVPIKFAIPPFDLRDFGTNYTLSDFDFATNGDYFGQTNIFDPFGGWTVPTNLVAQVISNTIVTNNYNQVSIVSDPGIAFMSNTNSSNYLALGYGMIQRTNLLTLNHLVTFSYVYRGPGISGWWRGEGDGRDSSDAETMGQNGSLIGRFNFPAGQVSQALEMENNGGEYDFAGTNGYVQIRQQPFYVLANNTGNPEAGISNLTQESFLDVGPGPGFTVEGWINPTNVSQQMPLVEWLARVPTNGSDTNLNILAGPFLDRATTHYYYMLGATNWTTSETWATQLGGHLATVDSADEQNWIFDTFGSYNGRSRNLWVGLTNTFGGNFGYSGGVTNISYTNWMTLETNNSDGSRNYTFMFGNTNTYPGLWALADNNGFTQLNPNKTNIVYGVVEVTNLLTNGVQFWISVTNVPGTTNIINTTNGCLFANLMDVTNGSHWIFSGPNLVQSNTWQHVALTYDTNSGIANLFYNGTNVASTNIGVIIPNTTGDVLLGKDMSLETNNYYGGMMDEMSIYSRALSDAEIAAIYTVSATTTNRLIGKFDPTITPPQSLAEAQVVFGAMTNIILGDNTTWQEGAFTFVAQTNSLPMQITGIQPGMLFDAFNVSEAPIGNLYYQPEQSLDELKGENANGNWTLEIWNTRNNTLATNAILVNWQLQMVLQTNTFPPVSIGSQEPTTVTVPPGQTISLLINTPSWATVATNILDSSTLSLNVYYNSNTPPIGLVPPDTILFGPATAGSATLFAPPVAPPPPNFYPGQSYYIGLQNPGTTAATAVFEVDFNMTQLTNDVPFNDTLSTTNGAVRYYSFVVSTNSPYEATFQLLRMNGNCDLVVSKGTLPTLTSSDYGSFNSGRANENIYVLTNSSPVPLSPGTWYLGVFNRDTNAVNYSVLAQELDMPVAPLTPPVTFIPLTNGVPLNFTAGPGAALTNFFTFVVTNSVTLSNSVPVTNYVGSIHFELYNLTGNGDLTVQTNAPPFAPPFFQSSQQPGKLPEFIQIRTNSVLTNLTATWYLGVPNETTNLINFTIVAVIDTNVYFPAFPGAEGAGAGALGASIRNGFTNNTVYHVTTLSDFGPGSLRDAVSSTNRTVVFDISGAIYLQSPLVITNSYLSILGQTAPDGGVSLAGASMVLSTNVHDVVIRYVRFRPTYSGQNLFVSENVSSGVIDEYSPAGVHSIFASTGLNYPFGLAYHNNALYVANNANDSGAGYVTEITNGIQITIPSGPDPKALAFNSSDDLFELDYSSGNIFEYTPGGVFNLFTNVTPAPQAIAINNEDDLFVQTGYGAGTESITEITPGRTESTFAKGLSFVGGLAFDGSGNLFEADGGTTIYEFTPAGGRRIFASGLSNLGAIAFNNAGDLFLATSIGTVYKFTPNGTRTTFASGLTADVGVAFSAPVPGLTAGIGGDALQFNTVSNVIADHVSAIWSSNNDLTIMNSSNVTVQWSILSDSLHPTNGLGSGSVVDTGGGTISLHHNLYADNAYANPQLGGNVSMDFVNNVVYDWGTNSGISEDDPLNAHTNYLNYICNYVIASTNSLTNNIAFWGGETNTWVFQTNNFIDNDTNVTLNGADTRWLMFTNLFTETNQFRLPPCSVDESYMAYEKVLDFAGVSMFGREPAETNIVENVRQQAGSIISSPGILTTNSSTLIYLNSSQDGIPDFWKITLGQAVTNAYNNFTLDSSGYSELEGFDNWLAGPHALTVTNTPVGVDLQKLFGKTGTLSFSVTNAVQGFVYLTNVLGSYTNTGTYSNSIAIFTPTNKPPFTTNYSGFASFDVYVTNNDTVGYFGPVTVSVFVGATDPTYSQFMGILLPDPVTNNIGANTIQWYKIFVPTNAIAATNTLVFAGAPMNFWYCTNDPPFTLSPSAFELFTAVTNGIAVVSTNIAPPVPTLVPGGVYFLGVENTNNFATNYAVGLDFNLTGTAVLLTNGVPQTNTVPAGGVQYYAITVPQNAIAATNIIDFDTGALNLWFNQTGLPTLGGAGDFELLLNFGPSAGPGFGSPVLTTNTVPPLVPGSTYYLAVDNSGGGSAVTYGIEVDFELFYTPPVLPTLTNIFAVAGTTFTVTNTAIDTNSGSLFYSLTTLPSVGATINTTNGIITWNVPTNEPATNILFTTIVTNSFTDDSATNSFTVTVIPEVTPTGPLTNNIPGGSLNWIAVEVPTNAFNATNTLVFATNFPVTILFTTNFPPTTNGAYTLMSNVTNGTSILSPSTTPTNIVPGGIYYLGVLNTNSAAVGYAIEVNFGLIFALGPPLSETLPATMVTGTRAQLNGFATPNGSPAYVWFDWGASNNYNFSTPKTVVSGGNNVLFVTNSISGLFANRVYHYRLDVSNALGVAYGQDQLLGVGGVAAWGYNGAGVTNVPLGLTNIVAIAAETSDGVALNNKGQISVWGDNSANQQAVPPGLNNVSSIAAGDGLFALALQNGVVTGWGDDLVGETDVPAGLSNVVEIAAGEFHGLALQNNGIVVAWGPNGSGQTSVPLGLSNVVSIAAGAANSLALLNNGTVVAWGAGKSNTGTSPNFGQSIVPAGLTNVVAITSFGYTSLALKSDGTVVAWGENNWGQTNVPGGLNDVVEIGSGLFHFLAAQETGLAVAWGNYVYGETNVPASLTNIYAVAGGNNFSLALESPLSINLSVTPIIGGTPQTNTIAANSVVYYSVSVPINAIAATNLLSFADQPLNIWFNQTNYPQPANPPDTLLLTNATAGAGIIASAVLMTNGLPPLLPGQTYILAIQNTNSSSANYVFGVNFDLTPLPPNTNTIFTVSIVHTNIGGMNGFLLEWYAPTNDTFQVQKTPGLQPVSWFTFSNIVTYTGPLTPTNGLFTFFDDGSQYPFGSIGIYRVLLLSSSNSSVTPITSGSPQTNTIAGNSVAYYSVSVPTNAIAASNLLSATTAPLNIWFNQSVLPIPTNPPDILLLGGAGNGALSVLTNSGTPPLLPGQTYYLAIQNTNSSAVTYTFGVNFALAAAATPTNPVVSVEYIHGGGSNGFLLEWYAPTNETFQVEKSDSVIPPAWMLFTGTVTYSGPPVTGDGLFTFFDNGSQYPFTGPLRIYNVLPLSSGGSGGSLVLPGQPNYIANVSQPLSITNKATDSNLGALVTYNFTNFPAIAPAPTMNNGVITWTPASTNASSEYKFTTVATDNSLPPLHATNAFTVFVMPAPSIKGAVVTSTNTTLTWTAPTNDLFQVEWTTNINTHPVVWAPFPQVITSTNGTFSFKDTNAPAALKFYDLLWLPLP